MFIDTAKINIKAGNGGNGSVSFHREKYVAAGGPDGGDGGRGGNVVFVADSNLSTLMDFRYKRKYTADNGENGAAALCRGKSAKELVIKVPVGTTVRLVSDGRLVADMHEAGQRHVLLHGGRGGWGNAHFATPTRQAPNFAKPGQKCEMTEFELELKSIADVGLVGYPNVGKSTILSVVTAARPKIANYHFTTLAPNLGICRQYGMDFVMADIPGLVEGASEGVGLGIRFLRHVERTRLLVHVVDISHPQFEEQIAVVKQTLQEIGAGDKPVYLVFNKVDAYTYIKKEEDDLTPPTRENLSLDDLKRSWIARANTPCIFLSALAKTNLEKFRTDLYGMVREIHAGRYPFNNFLY